MHKGLPFTNWAKHESMCSQKLTIFFILSMKLVSLVVGGLRRRRHSYNHSTPFSLIECMTGNSKSLQSTGKFTSHRCWRSPEITTRRVGTDRTTGSSTSYRALGRVSGLGRTSVRVNDAHPPDHRSCSLSASSRQAHQASFTPPPPHITSPPHTPSVVPLVSAHLRSHLSILRGQGRSGDLNTNLGLISNTDKAISKMAIKWLAGGVSVVPLLRAKPYMAESG